MYKNIIFDYGNVLIDYNKTEMLKPYFSDSVDFEKISSVVFDRLYWDRLDLGLIDENDVCELIKDKIPKEHYGSCCEALLNWYKNTPIIPGMTELLSDIKNAGKTLIMLTNNTKQFALNYRNTDNLKPLLAYFDGFVISAEIGIVKPNPEIFQYMLGKYGLKPEECLFVDDSEVNAAASLTVGIDSFLFKNNPDDLRNIIFNQI